MTCQHGAIRVHGPNWECLLCPAKGLIMEGNRLEVLP